MELFIGKGGVGKTTLACATAMAYARCGQRVLLASLDQAHSLGDALGFRFRHEPGSVASVASGLDVIEVDSLALLEDRFRQVLLMLSGVGHEHGLDLGALDPAEVTGLPGVQELLALLELTRYAAEKRWDVIIVDCPPTADMLRILTTPDTLLGYLERVWPEHSRTMITVGGDLRRAVLAVAVEQIVHAISGARDLLADRTRTGARLVTAPEHVAVAESSRVVSAAALLGLRLDTVLVNKVLPDLTGSAEPGSAPSDFASGPRESGIAPDESGRAPAAFGSASDAHGSAPDTSAPAGYSAAPGSSYGPAGYPPGSGSSPAPSGHPAGPDGSRGSTAAGPRSGDLPHGADLLHDRSRWRGFGPGPDGFAATGEPAEHPAVQWYRNRRAEQLEVVAQLRKSLRGVPVLVVGHAGAEPVGLSSISALSYAVDASGNWVGSAPVPMLGTDADGVLYTAPGPVVRLESGAGVQSVFAMRMHLPVVDPSTLRLGRVEDDLIVGADGVRRRLRLAPVLRRCTVDAAELDGDQLVIRFRPDPQVWPQ
ncbi:TRC40/GET3/ArsA family transport-energizing ATPase [Nocardia sp. NPDC088792]|uniref:TRC40/GET3/ArsA family transport-energizing ATPase n=1 Tax=Nocardia sp. NPDC088792 TaxID=3364332 RepID=UPI00381CB5D9